jgi:hypothetical protein
MIKAFLCSVKLITTESLLIKQKACLKLLKTPAMKKRFLKLLFLSGTLLTLLTACEYDYIIPTPPPPVIANDTISYSQDIQPIFNSSCISCHATVNPVLTSSVSYNNLQTGNFVVANSPSTSKLYIVCKPGGIMSSYCSSAKLNLISRWITAGAKND